jgi:hypothetical protein
MNEPKNSNKEYTVDEMIHCMHNPKNKLRSLAELDTVLDEIIQRNPEWYKEIQQSIGKCVK